MVHKYHSNILNHKTSGIEFQNIADNAPDAQIADNSNVKIGIYSFIQIQN